MFLKYCESWGTLKPELNSANIKHKLVHANRHSSLYSGTERRISALCQALLINYLVKEIGALCKLRPQGMLGPVYPEISSEGLRTKREGRKGQHTIAHINAVVWDESSVFLRYLTLFEWPQNIESWLDGETAERQSTSGRKLCFLVTWYSISWVSIAGRMSPFNTWDIHIHMQLL